MNFIAARGHFGGPDTKLVCFGNKGTASGKSFSATPAFFFLFGPWSGNGFKPSLVVVFGGSASTIPEGMRPAVSAAVAFVSLPEIS